MKYVPKDSKKRERLTTLRLILLRTVEKNPGISLMDLIEETGIDSNTVRGTSRCLHEEGLFKRVPSVDIVRIRLTKKGSKLLDDLRNLLT